MTLNADIGELTEVLAVSHGFSLGKARSDPKGNFVNMFYDGRETSITYQRQVSAEGIGEGLALIRQYTGYDEKHHEIFCVSRDYRGKIWLEYAATHPFFLAATFSNLTEAQLNTVSKSKFLKQMHASSQNYRMDSPSFTILYEEGKNDLPFGDVAVFFLERLGAKDKGIGPSPDSRLH